MNTWTTEWPKEESWYWFYGWLWGNRDKNPRLESVSVSKVQNGLIVVAHNSFLYESENHMGVWQKIDTPDFMGAWVDYTNALPQDEKE